MKPRRKTTPLNNNIWLNLSKCQSGDKNEYVKHKIYSIYNWWSTIVQDLKSENLRSVVSLKYLYKHICSGCSIFSRTVLSAAHCIYFLRMKHNFKDFEVVAGSIQSGAVYGIWQTVKHIRGVSGKYRAYLYISAPALFFIIGRVAFFKVIPTWLNNTVPAMFPLLETVLELTFRDGIEYARRIIFNRRFVIESLSFEWFFEFWK